jgi:hypothetical protein
MQLVDLSIALLQDRLLLLGCGDYLAQYLLQRCGVIRQGREIDLHASIMMNPAESLPMTPA